MAPGAWLVTPPLGAGVSLAFVYETALELVAAIQEHHVARHRFDRPRAPVDAQHRASYVLVHMNKHTNSDEMPPAIESSSLTHH